MAVDISKVVSVDFNVVRTENSLASYENTVDIIVSDDITAPQAPYTTLEDAIVGAYAERQYDAFVYFQLGGKKLYPLIVSSSEGATAQGIYDALLAYKKQVSNTANDFICVCIGNCSTLSSNASNLQSFMTLVNNAVAPNKMLILNSTNDASTVIDADTGMVIDSIKQIRNLIYKFYTAVTVSTGIKVDETPSTCGAELSIAAYLSQINITQANSMRDYCFTDESEILNCLTYDRTLVPTNVSAKDYDIYKGYLNFIDTIGNQNVNFGGNTVYGTTITSEWGAIASENGVVYGVLRVMLQKQYLTDGGLTNVLSEINNVLSDYVTNGFLETNTTYTGLTRYKNYGDRSYVLVENGQELPNGYCVVAIPMSRLTIQDRQARKFTPIFIYMQTMGGAREIAITGDILD